jgi:diguanylate cyclase (GGDEF)-like protein
MILDSKIQNPKSEITRLLLIEDNPGDARLIEEMLKEAELRFELKCVDRLSSGIGQIKLDGFDVILLDLGLPDSQGLNTLVKLNEVKPEEPVIVLTGLEDEATGMRAIKEGAQDYLIKGQIDKNLLARSINYAIERKRAEGTMSNLLHALESLNAELSIYYKVSSVISRTIDIDKMLNDILHTVTEIEMLKTVRTGGLFLVEEDGRMKLTAHLGHSDAFVDLHKNMKKGDCLCGIAAQTGEMVISEHSTGDARHTFNYPDMVPHGHICIPLKAMNKVVAVLYLYLPIDAGPGNDMVRMLVLIGEMAGIAISNAKLHAETKELSLHDPLTGLGNRRYMEIMFEKAFALIKRYGGRFSVIMLDIDDFKKYNDARGHNAGDILLADISRLIAKELRETDMAVRYGGEEFFIMLPETDLSESYGIAERIRKAIHDNTEVTVSLGVSACRPGLEKADITKMADDALYQAKNKGKNRVECIQEYRITAE